MQNYIAVVLGTLGALSGIYLSGLGWSAIRHLSERSEIDRVVGWTLWWWLDWERYDEEGRRLCRKGGWVFIFAVGCWVAAVILWKQ